MSLAEALLRELEQEARATRRALERIPEDKLGWRPHPKSMSLGQLAFHLAKIPGAISRLAAADTVEPPNVPRPEATSRREVLEILDDSLRSAREFLQGLDDARAMATWTMAKEGKALMAMPRVAVIRVLMLNHWYHHRGELCVYLRLLDVPVPAIYGPSADEAPFG